MDDIAMDEDWTKIQKEKLLRTLQNGDISQEKFDARDKKLNEEKDERKIRTNKILEIRDRDRKERDEKFKRGKRAINQYTEDS
jgi:hypothetical protein